MNRVHAENLWTLNGWQHDRELTLAAAQAGARVRYLLPGVCNAHSHAFQRGMAGLAERQTRIDDSFWGWRETMYRFASLITPDDLHAIAAQLYVEMLEAGYTSVCEFHYLHHQPNGQPYADPAAMSRALIAAASETGIRLCLLPVLYMSGGFDGRPLHARQRRFAHGVEAYLKLLGTLRAEENAGLRVGVALHSLRAVPAAAIAEVLAVDASSTRPIHIHIAEQIGEVQDCLAVRNARPIHWLFDHVPVGPRWQLVHATQVEASELDLIAESGASVVLCPSTEANLGDGLFPLKPFIERRGRVAIGSDSQVSVSPVEELRWLEYGQRLLQRQRTIAADAQRPSVGERLFAAVQASTPAATGFEPDLLSADLIRLDDQQPLLAASKQSNLLDCWIFSGNAKLVQEVWVAGRSWVRDGQHQGRAAIAQRYRETLGRLSAAL